MDQMVKMKAEDVKEVFEKGFLEPIPGPHFGGMITDPIPARVRKLEERVSKLETELECKIQETGHMDGITYGENSRNMWYQINELRETLPQAWEALYTMACKMQELERKIERQDREGN